MARAWALIAAALAAFALHAPAAVAAGASPLTPDQFAALAFDQHPGARLPMEAPMLDEAGRSVRLGQFFGTRPTILVLEYFHCPNLCGLVVGDLADRLDQMPLRAGADFQVLSISIDPHETPADARAAAQTLASRQRTNLAAGWHFLTGSDRAVAEIAQAVGFPYRFDAAIGQIAHPAGITLITPDGIVSRYLLGVDYSPLDLRLGLVEAARGTVAAPAARLLLLCFGYDPHTGRYSLLIQNVLRATAAATVAGLAGFILLSWKRRRGRE